MAKQKPTPKKAAPAATKKMSKIAASAANEGMKEYTYMALPKNSSKTTVSKKK